MFETLAAAPPDPILGLTDAFQQDPRPEKINLTSGVYRDEAGQTPVLDCVKLAEGRLMQSETSKGYLGIDGLPDFRRLVAELSLGNLVASDRIVACQTPGGTGALRVAADFLAAQNPRARVWYSTPTWPNHPSIFESAGLETLPYPYLAADRKSLDFEALLEHLGREGRPGDILLVHACCHNPTGIDPTGPQWSQLAGLAAKQGILPLIDFAYQGFGDGLEEDRLALAEFSKQTPEFLVCGSYSKNFGLYSERVGALLVVCGETATVPKVASNVKVAVRSNYSNPPRHGAAIVATILSDPALRQQWLTELAAMRERIHSMRQLFVESMKQTNCGVDFSFLLDQRGMFSYSGLTPMQVDWLRSNKGIYVIGSGRINVAGITTSNVAKLSEAIAQALRG